MAALLRVGPDVLVLMTDFVTVRDLAHMANSSNRALYHEVQRIQARRFERVLLRFPGWDTILNRPKMMYRGRSITGSTAARAEVAELVQLERATQLVSQIPAMFHQTEFFESLGNGGINIDALDDKSMLSIMIPTIASTMLQFFLTFGTAVANLDPFSQMGYSLQDVPMVEVRHLLYKDIRFMFDTLGCAPIGAIAGHLLARSFLVIMLHFSSWCRDTVIQTAEWLLSPATLVGVDTWDICRACVEQMGRALHRVDQQNLAERLYDDLIAELMLAHADFIAAQNEKDNQSEAAAAWARVSRLTKSAKVLQRTACLDPMRWVKHTAKSRVSTIAVLMALEDAPLVLAQVVVCTA